MPTNPGHIPIMVPEILDLLDPQPGETYVDLTLGRGGHAVAVAERIGATGNIVGFDLDPANVTFATDRLAGLGPEVRVHQSSFISAPEVVVADGNPPADMILADLGFSSTQMDDPERGFSFMHDGPLDMRLDQTSPLTAAVLVNESSERDLADLIFRYGEEPYSRKIAARIIAERATEPITTTARLAQTIRAAYGSRAHSSRMNPATRTFMALRIAVNDELAGLEMLWELQARAVKRMAKSGGGEADARFDGEWSSGNWIAPGARIAFLTFHSLEDRIVKRAMAGLVRDGYAQRLTKKPLTASSEEVEANPRARSAKLRAIRIRSPRADG